MGQSGKQRQYGVLPLAIFIVQWKYFIFGTKCKKIEMDSYPQKAIRQDQQD